MNLLENVSALLHMSKNPKHQVRKLISNVLEVASLVNGVAFHKNFGI